MKEIMQLHAKYNAHANALMTESLKTLSEEEFRKDRGLWFKSIAGTFEHFLGTDAMIFSGRYSKYASVSLDVAPIAKIVNPDMTIVAEVSSSMQNLFEARKKTDEFIVSLVDAIDDFASIKTLEFPGAKFEKPIYHLFIAIFTHATHHRGQIATALDLAGIENDFNGMLGV